MSKNFIELTAEQKLLAVQKYLSGQGSSYSIGDEYGVSDTSIRRWVEKYKRDGEMAFQKKTTSSGISANDKFGAVRDYLEGKVTIKEIAHKFGVDDTSVRKWIIKYQSVGNNAFVLSHGKAHYSKEFKEKVIQAYLSGEGSYAELCLRFKIPSFTTVQRWVMQYNNGRTVQGAKAGGTTIMKQGRKTTYEERVEIVSFCIENHKDYQLTAETYQVSYQQIYSWVKKYEAKGAGALMDRRGRTKPEAEMTELEKLRAENRLLKAKNKRQEMEMAFLKKLDELERGRF